MVVGFWAFAALTLSSQVATLSAVRGMAVGSRLERCFGKPKQTAS